MISRTVLIACERFGQLSAERVASSIGRGLCATDPTLMADLLPIEEELDMAQFDRRMRAARAVVLGAARLDEQTLADSVTFVLATRARQAGVPAYAVTTANALSLFDARMLDLQVVLRASDARALRRAGERLAGLV